MDNVAARAGSHAPKLTDSERVFAPRTGRNDPLLDETRSPAIGLLDRLRPNPASREATRLLQETEAALADIERRQLRGDDPAPLRQAAAEAAAALERAQRDGYRDHENFQLRLAQALLLQGRVQEALAPAYAAARARPYDVDSRVIHGRIRLALHEVEAARHEFASVLEEFGGDADANAGLRAAHLAAGELPLSTDEEVETGADRETGAEFLVASWELAGVVRERIDAAQAAAPDPGLVLLLERTVLARQRRRQQSG